MSDSTKIFVPEGNNSNDFLLGSLMNGGMGGNGFNNPWWALIFLAFLRNGWGGFGGDGNNAQLSAIQDQLSTNHGQTLLMDAIRGNGTSVKELASTIGCNFNAVQSAINGVQSAICNVANANNMNSMQIINAITSGDAAIANQLSSCCCDLKQLMTTQNYDNRINNIQQSQLISNGFSQIGYANAENTSKVIAKLDQIEDDRKNREINTLTAQLATVNARAERQAELAPLYKAVNDIQCKLPQTVTLPYSCATAVPTSFVYGAYGLNPYGYNNGQWS